MPHAAAGRERFSKCIVRRLRGNRPADNSQSTASLRADKCDGQLDTSRSAPPALEQRKQQIEQRARRYVCRLETAECRPPRLPHALSRIRGTRPRMRRLLRCQGFSLPRAPVARLLLLVARHVLPERCSAFTRARAGKRQFAGGVRRHAFGVHAGTLSSRHPWGRSFTSPLPARCPQRAEMLPGRRSGGVDILDLQERGTRVLGKEHARQFVVGALAGAGVGAPCGRSTTSARRTCAAWVERT